MVISADDEGTIVALLDRFRLQRLPQALALKEKVDAGETLDDHDIAFLEQLLAAGFCNMVSMARPFLADPDFLEQVFEDMRDVTPLVQRHPELESLTAKIAVLYKEITDKALANEKPA